MKDVFDLGGRFPSVVGSCIIREGISMLGGIYFGLSEFVCVQMAGVFIPGAMGFGLDGRCLLWVGLFFLSGGYKFRLGCSNFPHARAPS